LLWGFSCEVLRDVEDFMYYNDRNLESVINIMCTCDIWVSNKSIHLSKSRLQVTNARDKQKSEEVVHEVFILCGVATVTFGVKYVNKCELLKNAVRFGPSLTV
jgi:hypothetical protein